MAATGKVRRHGVASPLLVIRLVVDTDGCVVLAIAVFGWESYRSLHFVPEQRERVAGGAALARVSTPGGE